MHEFEKKLFTSMASKEITETTTSPKSLKYVFVKFDENKQPSFYKNMFFTENKQSALSLIEGKLTDHSLFYTFDFKEFFLEHKGKQYVPLDMKVFEVKMNTESDNPEIFQEINIPCWNKKIVEKNKTPFLVFSKNIPLPNHENNQIAIYTYKINESLYATNLCVKKYDENEFKPVGKRYFDNQEELMEFVSYSTTILNSAKNGQSLRSCIHEVFDVPTIDESIDVAQKIIKEISQESKEEINVEKISFLCKTNKEKQNIIKEYFYSQR